MTFSRLIDRNEESCGAYIAFIDNTAVGIVHFIYHLHLWQKEHICYLQDLFVDERFRKRGIAENLINEVYTEADQRKAKGVYWLTQDFNVKARGLYDKIGTQTSFIKYMRS